MNATKKLDLKDREARMRSFPIQKTPAKKGGSSPATSPLFLLTFGYLPSELFQLFKQQRQNAFGRRRVIRLTFTSLHFNVASTCRLNDVNTVLRL